MRTKLFQFLAAAACVAMAYGQGQNRPQNRPAQQNFDNVQIHVLPVQGNVYMIVGAGGNITMQVGKDGVLLVDTQYAQLSDKILKAIRTVSDGPLRYIINTHYHADHTSGNENLRKAGSTIAGGNVSGDLGAAAGEGAAIIAHNNVLERLSAPTGSQPALPPGGWPTSTYLSDEKKLWFNNEGIAIMHPEHAHTDGDSYVFFRKSDVISTGDIFTMTTYPIIDLAGGGSYQGLLDAVNHILDLTITVYGQDGGTLIVPGHGRLCDTGDLLNYREMVTIIRDRIVDMIKKGMTLEQVKAAKPTFDYDPLYGTTTGFWTTDMFVEAAYKSLSQTVKK
ncbi:MAG TPA: MBL fold metallo-hydrolase [Bryobacteraceae bacterium]|nr:MBL fold metallo-hydrolase [Bryobacteraceae bacterium]